jgi:hypothetical protein
MKIIGWVIICLWILSSFPGLLSIPSWIATDPLTGVGEVLAYFGFLALGIWLVKKANKRSKIDKPS